MSLHSPRRIFARRRRRGIFGATVPMLAALGLLAASLVLAQSLTSSPLTAADARPVRGAAWAAGG